MKNSAWCGILIWLVAPFWPMNLPADGPAPHVTKKPAGLRKVNPDPENSELTVQDRWLWKKVLNWCDECDERATLTRGSRGQQYGGVLTYPVGPNQYIVDIECYMTMRQSEHIYYKITEHDDCIESRQLMLEQFYHADPGDGVGVKNPKGEFIRFTDCLTYGFTRLPDKNQISPLLKIREEYRGMGGCGLYTVYDVSGDQPRVIEFRAKVECTEEMPRPWEYPLFTAKQRARWRIAPNPQRRDWKSARPSCSGERK